MGLVKLGIIAVDGTKLKANASRHKAMSCGHMVTAEAATTPEATLAVPGIDQGLCRRKVSVCLLNFDTPWECVELFYTRLPRAGKFATDEGNKSIKTEI